MKTPQRKFVVELKSARRRSSMRPTSIWGDTDLKALVREAEADAPHLFEPGVVSEARAQDRDPQPDPRLETHITENTQTGDGELITASPVEAEQTYPSPQDNDPPFNSVSESKEETSAPRSPRTARRRRQVSVKTEATRSMPIARSTAVSGGEPVDELTALEEENQRLKGQLTEHLLQQNMRLRKMLARFGVV